ncbi:cupin domain-containing protein [Rhodoferax sp. PAMC 29310]|uniref:cupin domain-containing protein n=1 Tax=Rhodoferax sp. PAMC 29310 TaxID=2822760 RepID=UPI001B3367CF|nr:cupin domain-containing protein [Rhodoferax sp. PAMC 29310]
MATSDVFFSDQQTTLDELEAGKTSRKMRARGGDLMMVEVFFKAGAIGYEHEHPHEQMCYCLSGEFVFSVGAESKTIIAGDSVYVPASTPHGAICIHEGRLLDIFTPQRDDFLTR